MSAEGDREAEFRRLVGGYMSDHEECHAADHLREVCGVLAEMDAREDERSRELGVRAPVSPVDIARAQLHGILAIAKTLDPELRVTPVENTSRDW